MAADRVIWWATAGAVVGVAAVAPYEHAYALVLAHAEAGGRAAGFQNSATGPDVGFMRLARIR